MHSVSASIDALPTTINWANHSTQRRTPWSESSLCTWSKNGNW